MSSIPTQIGPYTISRSCGTMHEWLVLHQHMIECIDKVQGDFSPLIQQGLDLSAPFENVRSGEDSPFVDYLCDAIENVAAVRCVFHDGAENRRLIGKIRMMHLDNNCLGPKFDDEAILFMPTSDHIGMMSNDRLLEYLDLIALAVA